MAAEYGYRDAIKNKAPEPSALPTKEYEIISFKSPYLGENDIIFNKDGKGKFNPDCESHGVNREGYDLDYLLNQPTAEIHSVRRLSDNVVFSAKEKLKNNTAGIYTEEVIKSFEIVNDKMRVNLESSNGYYLLSALEKLPPIEQEVKKPVLFTSDDGWPVVNKDAEIWVINPKWELYWKYAEAYKDVNWDGFKRFSTKEAAEQYIIDNKPCLSRNEVMGIVRKINNGTNGHDNRGYINSELFDLIQQKLNQ